MEKKSHAAQVNYMAAHEQLCVLNYLPQIKGNGWTSCRLPKKKIKKILTIQIIHA